MAFFRKSHDLHIRRFSRNLGLGLVLAAFVALVFGLTIAKVSNDDFLLPGSGPGNEQGGKHGQE